MPLSAFYFHRRKNRVQDQGGGMGGSHEHGWQFDNQVDKFRTR